MTAEVARLYHALIRARLRDRTCARCGQSLEGSSVVKAGEGTMLEEYGLSETSAARVLAATVPAGGSTSLIVRKQYDFQDDCTGSKGLPCL